jgi:allophanate hydrolase
MIEIIQTSPFNTVQDLGRPGYRNVGVTTSGAMDPLALRIGNLLLGNHAADAAIEVQTFPFAIRFAEEIAFAVTGAVCGAKLDGLPVLAWSAKTAAAGQVLELGQPSAGARAYVCIGGGLGVDAVLGSRSTSLGGGFGGHGGRYLTAGDRLECGPRHGPPLPISGLAVVDPDVALADVFAAAEDGILPIRALPAGEHDLFGDDAERFWAQTWKISTKSDRTGYRLQGEPIQPMVLVEMRSHGVVAGVVQVPPGGEPIIQMSDANTAGGYPKIAGIIDADLWRLGQARIGSRIRFLRSTHAEALAAEMATARYLDDVCATAAMVKRALKALA